MPSSPATELTNVISLFCAPVAELVDAPDSKSGAHKRSSSSLDRRTTLIFCNTCPGGEIGRRTGFRFRRLRV